MNVLIFSLSIPIIKLFICILFCFNKKNSSKILQRYYGLKHFYQNKYGSYDRKNYNKVNSFFYSINKQTNIIEIIKHLIKNKKSI